MSETGTEPATRAAALYAAIRAIDTKIAAGTAPLSHWRAEHVAELKAMGFESPERSTDFGAGGRIWI